MRSNIRVRFAPAPTGLLHIGNARTALFNFLFAKQNQGSFILRIEDTDLERSTDTSMDQIIEDLKWLGISWDEGPDRGGPFGPYRQSQRIQFYHEFAKRLSQEGKSYKCFCSEERLESLRKEQLSQGKMPQYDGRCRSLSQKEIDQMESSGLKPVLRFRVGPNPILFEDLIHGKMHFNSSTIGDFIIIRSDGMAAYNFACVIDDHLMQISHVIRGEDHLSNTPRQILLYQSLSWKPPVYAHHPLILGPDRSPLSKRHGATAVSQYREEGFLPEALQNYLVLLGWTPPSGRETLSMDQMIKEFSIQSISKSAPLFNRKKLEWLNSFYIRHKEEDQLLKTLIPYFKKANIQTDQLDLQRLKQISLILKENLILLSQVEQYLGIFFDEKFYFEEEAKNIIIETKNRKTLQTILNVLVNSPKEEPEGSDSLLTQLEKKTGYHGKSLYAPLRAAITGKTKGPELVKMLPILGRERIIQRLKMALEIS